MVGFDNVVALARQAGMNEDIRATPAVALGAYQVTPLEIAGAYTSLPRGRPSSAYICVAIHDHDALSCIIIILRRGVSSMRAWRFLMTDMLQEVMRSGTAAGVRARGFTLPAAGKTGTSHDGCSLDTRRGFSASCGLALTTILNSAWRRAFGAAIWTEFMMKAARYKQYGDVKPFTPPSGVVRVAVDPQTGLLAGPYCSSVTSYFIDGTQPVSQCAPQEPQEVEVSFTEDGSAIQRAASDQAPVPLTSIGQPRVIQPRVIQPPAIQPSEQQPPVQPPQPQQPPPPQSQLKGYRHCRPVRWPQ